MANTRAHIKIAIMLEYQRWAISKSIRREVEKLFQKNINLHGRVHTRVYEKKFWYKCPSRDCEASFQFESNFKSHLRLHDNDLYKCQYCPIRYADPLHFRKHLKQHFRIKDSKCDKCGLEFSSKWELNQHYKIHEGTIYSCLICNNYEASIKSTIGKHLKAKHAEIVGIHTFKYVQ